MAMDNVLIEMLESKKVDLNQLYHLFQQIGLIPVIPLKLLKGESIIRVRINDNAFFDDVCELSYPPTEKAALMRASLPGHPMFYGSIRTSPRENDDNQSFPRIVTLYETSEKLRDPNFDGVQSVTFSKWLIKENLEMFAFPISSNYTNQTIEASRIKNTWNNYYKKNIEKDIVELVESIGDLFAEKGTDEIYTITANAVNYILENDEMDYAGVLYPTQQLSGDGLNVALKPSVVDSSIKFVHAKTCTFIKNKTNATLISIADADFDTNGHIRWIPDNDVFKEMLETHPELINELRVFPS